MARMYKITAYLVDPNEVYEDGEQWFKEAIDSSECFCPVPIKHETAEFDWDDNLIINCVGCKREEAEEFFNENKI